MNSTNYTNLSKVSLAVRDGLVFLKFQQIGKDCKRNGESLELREADAGLFVLPLREIYKSDRFPLWGLSECGAGRI